VDPIAELHRITKDYRGVRALDGVDAVIGGGITGLLGPNGAGKSTLIKVMLGLVRLTSGSGHVLGHPIGREARAIRSRVGFMPEDDCYVPGLSGVETVRFAAQLSGLPAIEALRRAHEILDYCGMGQERYRTVETYSTGMRQKLKFAQAVVHDPDLLILDEPTTGLDPEERQALLRRITSLSRRAGKAVLVSTHILPDVQQVCDQIVILVAGKVRVTDRLENLSRPATPTLHVRVLGEIEPLRARIAAEGIHVELSNTDGLTVHSGDGDIAQRIWSWALEARVALRSLTPARNSLEQIFLDAVRSQANAHP
jgi:ABC-2 type transport system ATP-binding protein